MIWTMIALLVATIALTMMLACHSNPTPAPTPTLLTTSIETDRAALMALFNSTDGENWTANDGWGSSRRLRDWYGVSTAEELDPRGPLCYGQFKHCGRVAGLPLADNGLKGEIPPELGNLSLLQFLNLQDDQLSGEIPPELGNLTTLVYQLDLSYNFLTGRIPSELGQLRHLQVLFLGHNYLEGEIPAQLGNLIYLQFLHLEGNRLTGEVPKELGKLPKLERLVLRDNLLTGCLQRDLYRHLGQFAERNAGLPFC